MDIFLLLLTNLIPLYVIIGFGFIGGRVLGIDRNSFALFALYFCMPVVMFGFVAQLDLRPAYALLPVLSFALTTIMTYAMLFIARRVYKDSSANLCAMCASMGNTGYFGLPLVLLLFDEKWIGIYMFMLLGVVIHEATVGYYVAARGNFTVRDSLIKLAKFPSLYTMIAGLLVNFSGVDLPQQFLTYWTYFKGAYVIVGMMIIGIALGKIKKFTFGPRFLALTFFGKFIACPLLALGFNALDAGYFHLYGEEIHHMILIILMVPPAANITAFASQLDLKPDKAATTVLAGTVFALFYIPLVLVLAGIH